MPSALPLRLSAAGIDLSPRVVRSGTVAASPSGSSETTICTVTVGDVLAVALGVLLVAQAAWTVGASGTAVTLKLRQTDTSGTTVKSTGATTATAGNLYSGTVVGLDTAPVLPGQVYVLTMTVTAGGAASTVSAVDLVAVVI